MRPHQYGKNAMLLLCLTILVGACSPLTIDPIETKTAGWLDWDGEGGWGGASAITEGGMAMSSEAEPLVRSDMGLPMPTMAPADEPAAEAKALSRYKRPRDLPMRGIRWLKTCIEKGNNIPAMVAGTNSNMAAVKNFAASKPIGPV